MIVILQGNQWTKVTKLSFAILWRFILCSLFHIVEMGIGVTKLIGTTNLMRTVSWQISSLGCRMESCLSSPIYQCFHWCYGELALGWDPPPQKEMGALTCLTCSDGNCLIVQNVWKCFMIIAIKHIFDNICGQRMR